MSPICTRKTGLLSHEQTRTPALITLILPEFSLSLPAVVKKRGWKKIEDLNYPSSVRVVSGRRPGVVRGSYSSVRVFVVKIYFYAFILA
jgi:hypothetical protein